MTITSSQVTHNSKLPTGHTESWLIKYISVAEIHGINSEIHLAYLALNSLAKLLVSLALRTA